MFLRRIDVINMLHRIVNKKGVWHRPAHLDPQKYKYFPFDISWANLVTAMDLKEYNVEIAPSFSKFSAQRTVEMELMYDDITYYHYRLSYYHYFAWMLITLFFIDWEDMDRPARHWAIDNRPLHEFERIRRGFTKDDK